MATVITDGAYFALVANQGRSGECDFHAAIVGASACVGQLILPILFAVRLKNAIGLGWAGIVQFVHAAHVGRRKERQMTPSEQRVVGIVGGFTMTASDRALAASIAAAHPMEGEKPFLVKIGNRTAPRLIVTAYGTASFAVAAEYAELARTGERVEVIKWGV